MELIGSLEKQLAELNKSLPKLSAGLTKWLADYGWLLILVGAILSALSLIIIIPAALVVFGVSTAVGVGQGLSEYGYNPLISSYAWLSVLLALVSLVVTVVFEAMAVGPLKNKQHQGWRLIFIAWLINIVCGMIASIVTMQIGSLVFNFIVYAIGLYFLFQLRPHFLPRNATDTHKTPAGTKTSTPKFKPAEK